MKGKAVLFIMLAMGLLAFKYDKPAYMLYDSEGKKVRFSSMIEKLEDADVILFGEYHDNPMSHWLQLELTRSLYELKKENLVLGAEMFERDNQLLLDEMLSGLISEKKFEDEARLWPNYKTDYKPLVRFAKEKKLPFIATNIPRRYASAVFMGGFEALEKLSPEAKTYIAPLPFAYDPELACYRNMISGDGGSPNMHANENLPKAQAAKDATMAYFIHQNRKSGDLFIHYNGAYHSDDYESIVWYLKKLDPSMKIKTISTVSQADIDTLDEKHVNKADFIICVPENMTKTH
jgi:uncharacterized iron-regulated protein